MKLLRTAFTFLAVGVIVLPLRSANEPDEPRPAIRDEAPDKAGQPFFKVDAAFPRDDNPQHWGGFQPQPAAPLAPFLAAVSFAPPAGSSASFDPTVGRLPYGRSPGADAQYQMQSYLATQQTYAAYTQWRNSRSPSPSRIWLPGMGATSASDPCAPGAHLSMLYNPTFGGMAGSGINIGQCFVGTTPVVLASGKLSAIEGVTVGARVALDAPESAEPITPATWRQIELRAVKRDGTAAEIVLLRPASWLLAHEVRPAASIQLNLPGCGYTGPAVVTAIRPCPAIPSGTGALVTGTIRHSAAVLVNLHVSGLNEPVGTTANHRFWSEDRDGFVRADELAPGERLRGLTHSVLVDRLELRPTPSPVYNLEVAGGMFPITRLGVCVRDAGTAR